MKLVVATPLYPPEIGGPATYAKLLADGLPAKGIEIELVKFADVRRLPKIIRHYAYYRRVLRAVRGADAVLALDPVPVGLPAALAARKARKPFVVKIVGDYAWEQGRQRFGITQTLNEFVKTRQRSFFVRALQRIQTRVARQAREIIVPSEYLKHIVTAWKIPHEKITVIYNSVELPEIRPPQGRPAGFLIVSSGRRVPWKGFDALERVAARERGWHLFIASGLPRAETLGWVRSADVFVLNSSYEGFSHALIEAMALGTPVIATKVGGNPELIEDGITGLLVPPGDDDALFAALSAVARSPEAACTRAEAARARAGAFSTETMLSATAALLTTIQERMNVLMISGDTNILALGSAVHTRLELQRSRVNRLDVFVWPQAHATREILAAAKRNTYDVVTAQDPFWRGLVAWLAARRSGARFNLQIHADLAAQSRVKRAVARFTLRRADSVRTVSEKLAAQVRALAERARVSVLPIYIDIDRFKRAVPESHAPRLPAGRQKTILWIGRFEPEKDPLRAVEVLRGVRAQGVDAKLVMLGAGDLEPALRRTAEGLPVEFPGWRDPLPYLQAADVALSTSRVESWGASIIEALAAGVPVVAPDVGVAREAGAVIAERSRLAEETARILRSGARGALKLSLPGAIEWATLWRQTLDQ